jgi:hypothetical protein
VRRTIFSLPARMARLKRSWGVHRTRKICVVPRRRPAGEGCLPEQSWHPSVANKGLESAEEFRDWLAWAEFAWAEAVQRAIKISAQDMPVD